MTDTLKDKKWPPGLAPNGTKPSRAVEVADAIEWVAAGNGSAPLKSAVGLKLVEEALPRYRKERLRAERPELPWYQSPDKVEVIFDPSEAAMADLKVAKAASPTAHLGFLKIKHKHEFRVCPPHPNCRKKWDFEGEVVVDLWRGWQVLCLVERGSH